MCRKIKEHSGRVMAVLRVYVDNIHQLEKVEKTLEALGKTKRYKISGWIVSRGARTVKKSEKNLLLTQGEAILRGGSNLSTWRCLGRYLLTLFARCSSARISGRSNWRRFSNLNLSALFCHSDQLRRV